MLLNRASGAAQRSAELHRRLGVLIGVVAVSFLVLIGRLWQLQVVRGDQYYEAARKNLVAQRYLPALRGKILDRHGVALADNRPAFNLWAVPAEVDATAEARLATVLGLDADEVAHLAERLATGRAERPHDPLLVLEDQSRDRVGLLAQQSAAFPGIEVRTEAYRRFPGGVLAGHLIGYLSHPKPKELTECEADGCTAADFIGRYGIERQWENYLRGKRGIERFLVDAKGARIDDAEAEGLIEGPRKVDAVTGHDVVLTLDLELQKRAEKAVARYSAAAVVLVEVDSGRILAMVSTPSFDPNVMTGHLTRAADEEMKDDPRTPYIDKTVQQQYPPGSVYKFVTAGAALEDGLVTESEQMTCPGYYERGGNSFRCEGEHGKIDLLGAIQHSCNVYFWKLSERVGLDRMSEVATDFGFGAPSGLGLNGDVAGRAPTKEWYERRAPFKIGYTLNSATGQGDVAVTVLQVAMAYAAIANGGRLYVPQIVQRVVSASGETIAEYEPVLRRRVALSAETLEVIRRGLWRVVNQLGGTAYDARSQVLEMAGKTGTAQVVASSRDDGAALGWSPRRAHAWFAGYAPADRPEVAIAVLVEHGGAGGKMAAPVARELFEAYFAQKAAAASPAPGPAPAARAP